MVRKLKTYQTSLGFCDLAIAAPSMKAALEAWGAGTNLFHQGIAKETDDPDVVAATMSKPRFAELAISLLQDNMPFPKPVRLLAVSLSSLQADNGPEPQLDFGL